MRRSDIGLELAASLAKFNRDMSSLMARMDRLEEAFRRFRRREDTGRVFHAFGAHYAYVVVNADIAIYQDHSGQIVTVASWKQLFDNAEGHWAEDCPTFHAS